MSKLVSKKSI